MARVAQPAPSSAVMALVRWTLWAMAYDAEVFVTTRFGTRYGPTRIVERDHTAPPTNDTTVRIRLAGGDWHHVGDLQKIEAYEG